MALSNILISTDIISLEATLKHRLPIQYVLLKSPSFLSCAGNVLVELKLYKMTPVDELLLAEVSCFSVVYYSDICKIRVSAFNFCWFWWIRSSAIDRGPAQGVHCLLPKSTGIGSRFHCALDR